MSQRVEAVLEASGLRGPATASLEGASGLFALTDELLLFHDGHGTRRVTLRDLARIHSDAEGTLRVETPAGVAMSASLIGFDGEEVQQFFGQVRDVTARVKSLVPPPVVPSASEPAPASAPATSDGVSTGVTVTPVRRSETQSSQTEPPPKITVHRRGRREEIPDRSSGMRENGLGLAASSAGLDRNLPPPGSVEIRAVRNGRPEMSPPPVAQLQASPVQVTQRPFQESADQQLVVAALPQQPVYQDPEPVYPDDAVLSTGSESAVAAPYPADPYPADPSFQPAVAVPLSEPPSQEAPAAPPRSQAPQEYTAADLARQARKVDSQGKTLKLLGGVLIVGAVIVALLMFLNAQRLLALWALIAGGVGGVALLLLAEYLHMQTIQATLFARRESQPSSSPESQIAETAWQDSEIHDE